MAALSFSLENQEKIQIILSRYPNKMAACLPILYLAQEQFGYLSTAVQTLVAEILDLPASHVHGVATFYALFKKREIGRYHLQVCTNVSCMLCGGYEVLHKLESVLNIHVGETTPDGLFTLSEVECLAHCGTGPVIQVNEAIYELASPEKIEAIINELRQQHPRNASEFHGGDIRPASLPHD
jgi:NADH-quinone oxidoreductase E subunit